MPNSLLNYSLGGGLTQTPQTQPIPGRESEMVQNNAGGFGFSLDKWERLNRFLILGSEGGTYYVNSRNLTKQNAQNLFACIQEDSLRVLARAAWVSSLNLAPKTDPYIFAVAACLARGDLETKRAIREHFRDLIRTGTHLLHFCAFLNGLGGWGPSKRKIVSEWFLYQNIDKLAYQVLKYQNRDGWTMRDVLRLAHPKITAKYEDSSLRKALFKWIVGKAEKDISLLPDIIREYEYLKIMLNDNERSIRDKFGDVLRAINYSGFPRECLPTNMLNTPEIQRALFQHSPIHALIRNISQIYEENIPFVTDIIRDEGRLHAAKVHPFAIMLAQLIYTQGHGARSNRTWVPQRAIIEALDDAYDLSFGNISPSNKKLLVGIDISGSMNVSCTGSPISCANAALGMALTICRSEPNSMCIEFNTKFVRQLPITSRTALSSLSVHSNGGTNLAAPIEWALDEKLKFDAFVLLTDNETWAGTQHSTEALAKYRREINSNAKLICCSMAANHANIVDPNDPNQLGCAGLDASLPALIKIFVKGE